MKKILYLLFLTFYFRADICLAQSAVNCATAGTIACGTNFTGTTAGAGNDFNASDFPCNQTNSLFNGNDRVYKVSVSTSGYHTFKLTELNADLDIFLLTNACENGIKIKDACIDFSANPAQNDEIIGPIFLEAGAPYYLIIDAFDAAITSTFRIQVQCPAVSTSNFCTPSANVRPLSLKDNFEAYTLGNIAPQSSKWKPWRFNSGDGLVSNDRAFSGSKSLKIQSTNPPSDVIYQMGYLDQGRYRISWKMYIPSGKTAYYNLLHKYDNPEHWAYHVFFSENGKGQVNNYNILTDISFTYEYNKWFSVTQIVDISSDEVELFIAGKYIASWKFSNSSNPNAYNNKLAGINFAAVKSSDQFYVDDICIRRAGCFDCILTNQKVCMYPGNEMDKCLAGCAGYEEEEWTAGNCTPTNSDNCPECFQCFTWRKGNNENEIYFDNNYCEEQVLGYSDKLESRNAVTYDWDFGSESVTFLEGTNRNSQNPRCKFPRPGKFKICFKVYRSNVLLFECCKIVHVNPCSKPPVPQLTYTINETNGEVQFDASATTDAEVYEWDFGGGDALITHDIKPKRRYQNGRCYTVCYYASNGCGTSKICITVCPGYSPCMNRPLPPKAPVPNFNITDDVLQISGISQGEYEKIEWTLPGEIVFESGSTINSWNPKCRFKKPGYYQLCAILYFKCHKVCFCWTVYYPGCCQNRCANVKEITCGTRYDGSTLNSSNSFTKLDYSNCHQTTSNFDGNDVVFKYKHSSSWPAANILLWGFTTDLDLFLLNNCGTPAACIKKSTNGTRDYEFIDLTGIPTGEYYIVVDGYNTTQKSQFKISVACQQGCTDPATIDLKCNTSVVGNTETCEINFNNKYSCDPDYRFSGPECYYHFTAPEAGEYTFDLFGFGNKNLDLFILDYTNCKSTPACIKYSVNNIPGQAEQVKITLAKNQLITVVVDGSFGDGGEYALTTLCPGFATTKLTFDIDDNICDAKGKTIQVPVKVLNFTNIRSFQMSLKSENSSIVSIKSINSAALSGVDFIEIEAGKTFNIFYNKQTPISLTDGSTAFTIEVELKGNVNQSSKLFFTNSPLDIKAGQFVNNVTSSVPVDVKDGSACIANSTISLIGKITTAMNTGINNVIVKLSGQQTAETKTNTDGNFNFANLTAGSTYAITPEKNVNANNGLDIFDLSFLQDMIIGRTLVANPYKLLAADINRDGALDIFDLGELQDIIIGRRTNFSNNTSWVFLPKSENLTIQKVNSNTYTKSITITNASASRSDLDFYGVKIGDLVEDANPKDLTNETNNANQVEVRSVGSFSIQLPDLKATKEQIIYVPVTLTKFKDIRAFQFNVSWNNAQLEYLGIDQFSKDVNSFTENNILKIEYGKLNVVWLNNNNLSLPDNTKLFYIKFKVLASKGNILDLNFEGVKATELAGPVSDILSTNGKVTVSDVSTSFYPKAKVESSIQLFPNPAIKYIMISSPFEYEFVEISDLNGRKVYSDHGKHQHQNNIDLSLYSSGVYILKIKIKDDIYFKKFVKE